MRLSILTLLATLALLVPVAGASHPDWPCLGGTTTTDPDAWVGMCHGEEVEPYCHVVWVGMVDVQSDGWCIQEYVWWLAFTTDELIRGGLSSVGPDAPVRVAPSLP